MGSQTHQLDRLGRELKCPICLSLLQQAASLTCNHTFCRSCILQSIKSTSACPICKVHTTRREVRAAPQMDSLVAIFVSMGSAAGFDIMTSQNILPTGETVQAPTTSKSRTALSNITNQQKSLQIPKEIKSSDYTFKGAIPAKKRIQVPKPSILQELEANRDDTHITPQSDVLTDKCGLTAANTSPKPSSRNKKQNKRKGSPNEVDAGRDNPCSSKKVFKKFVRHELLIEPTCSKHIGNKAFGKLKETQKEASAHVQASCKRMNNKKRKGKDTAPLPCGPLSNAEKDSGMPVRDDSSRKKLDPFFWLRDENSQDRDAIQVTQTTLTQSTVRPNFSDLKDSDDDIGLDANEEFTNGIGICEPGSYDSDDFDWTQHPSSPELRCSPSKNQGSAQDLVIDISLEASHPCPKELLLDARNACNRHSQDTISTEALVESASKVFSIAQKNLDAAVREDKERRKFGRMKSYERSQKAVDVCAGDVRSQSKSYGQQNHQSGCSNKSQSKLPICDDTSSEKTKLNKPSASRSRHGEVPSKPKSKRVQENNAGGCSIKPKPTDIQPCKISAPEELKKLSASSKRNNGKHSVLSKRKRDPESIPMNAADDIVSSKSEKSKGSVEPCLPVCVFCGSSKDSQITGSMGHFNEQGIPLGESGQDGKMIHVHKHCAEWAPDVYFVEEEARNLPEEAARGLKIKCFSCGKRGAALGCCLKRCRRSYHYPCARALSCKWEEEGFIMLCPEHKAEKFPVKKSRRRRASAKGAQKSSLHMPMKTSEHAGPGQVEEIPVKWTSNQSSKWVLCGSALDAAGKNQLATFGRVTGATISKSWTSNVTHVIAGTDLHNAARRTMKFLLAILEGKWVVKLNWLSACIEAGKPVSEEPFEIGVDIHGAIEGPKQGRLRAAEEGQKLFGKLQFYFMPDFLPSYKGDLQALVAAGGGGVLHRKPIALADNGDDDDAGQRKTLIVYNSEMPNGDKKADRERLLSRRQGKAQELAACVGANVVSHQWILDSIGASKVQQPLE